MKKTATYWQDKLSFFLHDPVHKALDIPKHEDYAKEIAEFLYQTFPSKDTYTAPDSIASGLTRASLPGHSSNENESGSVNFSDFPTLSHPLIKKHIESSVKIKTNSADLHAELKNLLNKDIGLAKSWEEFEQLPKSVERPLSGLYNYNNTPEDWAAALYMYLFFALKKRLRQKNIGNIGPLWDLLPADTRIPDHSIWTHCGLTSAIGSAMSLDKNGEISLTVFSLSPVQAFISKARKLRDSWVASVMLSYLTYVGIRYIIKTLGPDHLVYPSLQDQSLVEDWIGKEYNLERFLKEDGVLADLKQKSKDIASFPNKFVFIGPSEHTETLAFAIEKEIQDEWLRLSDKVLKTLKNGEACRELFEHQVSDYWNYSWASTRLLSPEDSEELKKVLHPNIWENEYKTIKSFAKNFEHKAKTARLYASTHSLVQSLLAAGKLKPNHIRKSQNGEKCPLCGEHEVLHDFIQSGESSAADYAKAVKVFWDNLREQFNTKDSYAQIGKNERLCAICTIKRFLPYALKNTFEGKKDNELFKVFSEIKSFPSTTEIAAKDYIKRLTGKINITREEYPDLLDALHNRELEIETDDASKAIKIIKEAEKKGIKYRDEDKYYAFLLMDGDKMGDLLNGKTLSATWLDVLHPELAGRFSAPSFHPDSPLREAGLKNKRTINPSVHMTISDALNSSTRFAVAPLIDRGNGRLIYAGGDDVCAFLPTNSALETAEKIAKAYQYAFVKYNKDGAEEIDSLDLSASKIAMHLGKAEGISISGAILIAHHKEPLREVFRDAHRLLDSVAKEKAGRAALAIRLKKRSGGDRDIFFKWAEKNPFIPEETKIVSFKSLIEDVKGEELSSSLIYRLENLHDALHPLIQNFADLEKNKERIIQLFSYEIGHSGLQKENKDRDKIERMAKRIAGLCLFESKEQEGALTYEPEGIVIARFFSLGDRE